MYGSLIGRQPSRDWLRLAARNPVKRLGVRVAPLTGSRVRPSFGFTPQTPVRVTWSALHTSLPGEFPPVLSAPNQGLGSPTRPTTPSPVPPPLGHQYGQGVLVAIGEPAPPSTSPHVVPGEPSADKYKSLLKSSARRIHGSCPPPPTRVHAYSPPAHLRWTTNTGRA